mmetsp:Transcript_7914/g.21639  ORF Transcript_7914/g.21639 Transcript_7914/m.21639 type:complete len:320 (-) Transcript_7914:2164-3123(-)
MTSARVARVATATHELVLGVVAEGGCVASSHELLLRAIAEHAHLLRLGDGRHGLAARASGMLRRHGGGVGTPPHRAREDLVVGARLIPGRGCREGGRCERGECAELLKLILLSLHLILSVRRRRRRVPAHLRLGSARRVRGRNSSAGWVERPHSQRALRRVLYNLWRGRGRARCGVFCSVRRGCRARGAPRCRCTLLLLHRKLVGDAVCGEALDPVRNVEDGVELVEEGLHDEVDEADLRPRASGVRPVKELGDGQSKSLLLVTLCVELLRHSPRPFHGNGRGARHVGDVRGVHDHLREEAPVRSGEQVEACAQLQGRP